ncbi:MAG: exo-alpha-sialidase [Bryobacteraceae bacterium]
MNGYSRRTFQFAVAGGASALIFGGEERPAVEHSIVYKESGRFGGWPANHGIWSWSDEIVVGFRSAHFKVMPVGHARDPERPQDEWQARSMDGGKTWSVERPPGLVRPENGGKAPVECPGGINFTDPAFALMFRASGEIPSSRFYYSTDRCRTWKGPYTLPLFGQLRIMARTDYLVDSTNQMSVFLTAAKRNGKEGRVFMARTMDGARTWKFVSWIGLEPDGFSIMPSSVRLSKTRILTMLRRKEGAEHWIDAWVTDDDGSSWKFLNRPVPTTGGSVGNPPSLLMLQDGRLALIYGFRSAPYGIRARLSIDNGLTWGNEIVLRDDAGCWDLGYPRSVNRPDGKVVTAYYYNDDANRERYIAATIWDPPRPSRTTKLAQP